MGELHSNHQPKAPLDPTCNSQFEGDNVEEKYGDLENQLSFWELPVPELPEARIKPIHNPIWTENKAKLIKEYLYRFVMVTHHGTYIDAFAGPQVPDKHDMWAAKLVLESNPRWLRHFYLFEKNREKIKRLKELKKSQPEAKRGEARRNIQISRGDCNNGIIELLASNVIKQKEATFCLLDQRTFECHWSTVEALSKYKFRGCQNRAFLFPCQFMA